MDMLTTKEHLLKSKSPSIRKRCLIELEGYDPSCSEIKSLNEAIIKSKPVVQLLEKMHPDGYWLQKKTKSELVFGDGVEYLSYSTTHFVLSYLMELGLDKDHPKLSLACERYLNLLNMEGDWWNNMSCLTGMNIRTFVKLGYVNDERVHRAMSHLLESSRYDGGFLCDMHEKKSGKKKSCYRGSVKVLLALAELPALWGKECSKKLVDYFIRRNGIYSTDLQRYVTKDIEKFSFPITWKANAWEVLLAISKMGYGNHKAFFGSWRLLESKLTQNHKVVLDFTPSPCPFKVGKKGEENEWLTFYACLATKYKRECGLTLKT